MFCGNCGYKLKNNAEFCANCGTKVENSNTNVNKNISSGNVPDASNITSNPPNDAKTTKNKGLIVGLSIGIGALAMVVVVLIAVLIFGNNWFGNNSINSEKYKNTNPNAKNINMMITQIETSMFPDVAIYTSVKDSNENNVTGLAAEDFQMIELGSNGDEYLSDCKSISMLSDSDELNVNLVIDQSASMNSSNKMSQAKSAANKFVSEISSRKTSNLELTTFDDHVYNKQPFTNNSLLLQSSISSIKTNGNTALYDALYWAIQRTSMRSGSRFVVAFTDGEENRSIYTENEVIELSKKTGIPVYIIGVGDSINRSSLQSIASKCKGQYYDCSVSNMTNTLSSIYSNIYAYTESLYKFIFTSANEENLNSYRTLSIVCKDGSRYIGECQTTYAPKNDISLYENKAVNGDYVLPDSNSRYYSESELQSMSIWDLYLARNEIYARHGRDFKHRDLKEYFATKSWYSIRYSPEEFDRQEASKFNDFERKNADLMLKIEKSRNSPYLAP